MSLKYGDLRRTNPDYQDEYWRICELLYSGGSPRLWDQKSMHDLFPRHANERDDIYSERCRRAYYTSYSGEIIDHLVSALFSEPVKMRSEPEADPFYQD